MFKQASPYNPCMVYFPTLVCRCANIILGGGNSNMFYFHPYLGKISILTNIFQMGWNHQPVFKCLNRPQNDDTWWASCPSELVLWIIWIKQLLTYGCENKNNGDGFYCDGFYCRVVVASESATKNGSICNSSLFFSKKKTGRGWVWYQEFMKLGNVKGFTKSFSTFRLFVFICVIWSHKKLFSCQGRVWVGWWKGHLQFCGKIWCLILK